MTCNTSIIDNFSESDKICRRDRDRDRHRAIRDAILERLRETRTPMAPADLSRITGIGLMSVSIVALAFPSYFEVQRREKKVLAIDMHRHLKVMA
jgi:hypothetical protein